MGSPPGGPHPVYETSGSPHGLVASKRAARRPSCLASSLPQPGTVSFAPRLQSHGMAALGGVLMGHDLDPVLAVLLSAVEESHQVDPDLAFHVPVTINCNGLLVSGDLISQAEYGKAVQKKTASG